MKMTFRTVVIGGLIVFFAVMIAAVFIPTYVWNPPQTTVAHLYTPEEARGREVFLSNGCNYCHTQYVREEDTAMGPVSQGGDYVFDDPMILGSERTGPDLSYVGHKRSQAWEIAHLKDPRLYSPLSIMPDFTFLSDDDLQAVTTYLFSLGDRVAQERMILPPDAYSGEVNPHPFESITADPNDPALGWTAWTAANLQEGKELYVTNCLTCHGPAGNGLGSYAGTMSVTPADYRQEPFRNMPDDQWIWHVSEGIPGTLMPTWKASLTSDQIWSVIGYVQQIFARPMMRDPSEGDPTGAYADLVNPLPLTVENVEAGKTIFTRECSVCHGTSGTGDGIYSNNLQPSPPDFSDGNYGTLKDPSYTDADYFWRISVGLPWSAMPAWKSQYTEDQRWELVHYIRTNFTQTEVRPVNENISPSYPEIYLNGTIPETASFERGKQAYLTTCAQCHGLSGQGDGWDGLYLDIKPSDLSAPAMKEKTDGELLVDLTFGVPNTAHPVFGEILPESQRWDIIKFIKEAFIQGLPFQPSLYADGAIGANVLSLSQDNWIGEGHDVSVTNGESLYKTNCATCHGTLGNGDGPAAVKITGANLAPFAPNMNTPYIFGQTWYGISGSSMPPFQWLLSESDIWDITAFIGTLPGQGGGK